MTVLVNTLSVQFGSLRYDTHATHLSAELGLLPGVNLVTCDLPPQVEVSASPGDDAIIKINNGEASTDVLTGTVRSISRGLRRTRIIASDAGASLAALRIAKSYQDMRPGEIIRDMAGEAGVDAQSLLIAIDTLPVYVAAQSRTAAEHVAILAALGGGYAHVGADGGLMAQPWPILPASAALLQGRELIEYAASSHTPDVDVALIGASPAAAGADPRAMAQTTEAVSGGADTAGPSLQWLSRPALRSGLAVKGAADGARSARAARQSRMQATCWLLPALRPGQVIEVQGVPDGVSGGPWMLTRVSHSVARAKGGTTRIEGVSSEGSDLLGALGGLIGGLL